MTRAWTSCDGRSQADPETNGPVTPQVRDSGGGVGGNRKQAAEQRDAADGRLIATCQPAEMRRVDVDDDADTAWGTKDFYIEDPDGRILCFGGVKGNSGATVSEQVIQVVNRYIDAVRTNDASLLSLHPDVVGEFPTSTYHGAEAFLLALEPFARIVKRIDVLRLVVDGERCVALLEIDTAFGPIAFAEHIHVVNGQIVFVRGYYDPRPIVDGRNAAIARSGEA